MTLTRTQFVCSLLVAFVIGVGTVTGTGYCLACKNAQAIRDMRLDQDYDAQRIDALEATR